MENIFMNDKVKKHSKFSWEDLGDIREGRGDLGEEMPVLVYRLMQYTMLDALSEEFGEVKANSWFKKAGLIAGTEFAKNALNLHLPLKDFVADLQNKLKEMKICIFRIEQMDPEGGELVVTAAQDLDCSGIPVTNETVCTYDEGFISGIFGTYFKKPFDVEEVDCWANGNRVCRFKGGAVRQQP